MTRRVSLTAFATLLLSASTLAQHSCPEGFKYAGTLRGTGSYANDFKDRRELYLPQNATIDPSYQQTRVRASQGNQNAHSNLLPKDIPKGIHIIPYGSTDLEKGWAVSDPVLTSVNDPAGGTRYQFGMKLYCTTGTSEATKNFGGCSIEVEVCYKPKK